MILTDTELETLLTKHFSSVNAAYSFLDRCYWQDRGYTVRQLQAIHFVLLLRAEQGWSKVYQTPKQRDRLLRLF